MAISLLCNNIWPSFRSSFRTLSTRNREECCPKSSRTSCQAMHGAVDAEANPAPGNSSTKMGSMSFARDRREPSPASAADEVDTRLTRRTTASKFFELASNYGVVPWIISTSSVMRLTNLPWVVDVPNENIWIIQPKPSLKQRSWVVLFLVTGIAKPVNLW